MAAATREPIDPNSRITDLEIKITYLEETVQELNKIVFRQQRRMDQLEGSVKTLQERIGELEENKQAGDLPHEKPPHY